MKGERHIGLRGERLGVSRSGYSRWESARPSTRSREDATLKIEIARFHRAESRQRRSALDRRRPA
jgi:transcriptional regulator with XRE-family HTH domain